MKKIYRRRFKNKGSMHPLGIIMTFLLAGIIMYLIAMAIFERVVGRKISACFLLKDFGQKMWMTIGLGLFFATTYLLLVFTGSYLFNEQARLSLLLLMRKHPVDFVYFGLLVFACLSLLIYLVRLIIKHLYNTRNL